MNLPKIERISSTITIKTLRDYILNNRLTENDTILLHTHDFDELALEHHNTYREAITLPYLLISVLIQEDKFGIVSKNRIGIIKNDTESNRNPLPYVDTFYDIHEAYRCGWCGNIVDEEGYALEGTERERMIGYLEGQLYQPVTKHVTGKCCANRSR